MVRVDDVDIDNLDLIDRVVTDFRLSPNPSFTPTVTVRGFYGIVTMQFKFRVTCRVNYHGSDCGTYCVPQDSDELGHYTCDSNGRRVCRSGYIGEDCRTGTVLVMCVGRITYVYTYVPNDMLA